ncbi:alpha-soluble NSF attachment protein, putative [Perkinsus marinus ATCC 50983]|uniref:Alpha-soluble NSF attachment protein, putative n=1 Tax=Perkinsus marinus (strain ATCC 50983 / TXsc) TaxID=423536 RepID=C5LRZ8_PERM5|nr:alpha-soluble NSF attachment protein, putative [Perkinsus marinus ATCC 50983]EER00470.1 alpha-soluble NSF attachment protein, putative [Perkinsus marinus ATCC 50983]|eukprot:XP_002767752.1 alpha-soluble NSF attachment protein, putative [Perkinsus marinus ATCC 50983]
MSFHQAEDMIKEAEQKAQGSKGIFSFLGGGPSYDEAADLYKNAANQFKLLKDWNRAGETLVRAGEMMGKYGSASDEAHYYEEAGNAFRRAERIHDAITWYEHAVKIYSSAGRFQAGGKILRTIAEISEEDIDVKAEEALTYYKKAADMFEMDEYSKAPHSQCMLKVAELSAEVGKYEDAAKIFEKEGEKALHNSMLQFGAREHFLKAGIMWMCAGDPVTASIAVERYMSEDPRLATSREGELLQDMTQAFSNNDVDAFVDALHKYDSVTRLDAWKTEMLCKVKEIMAPSAENQANDVDLT